MQKIIKAISYLFTISLILTACTQTQPQSGSVSPVVDAYKKSQQIQKTVEERREATGEVMDMDVVEERPEKQIVKQKAAAEVEATSTPASTEIKDEKLENKYFPVVKIVDGDTIDVSIDGQTERIRFIGLNTPETVDSRKPVECFGQEASKKVNEVLSGREVLLKVDSTQGDRDKYGRLLRYVYLKDGTDVALKVIKDGFGYEYTYELPYKNQKQYNEAEAYARENGLGLWAPGICVEETKESESEQPAPEPEIVPTLSTSKSAELKIAYIFYDGEEGRSEPDEYVEIKNSGGQINLKGYTLMDESGKIYTFKDFDLATNQSVKVLTGCGDNVGDSLYWCFTSSAIWNNSGDTATLKNPSGGVVDSYNYKK